MRYVHVVIVSVTVLIILALILMTFILSSSTEKALNMERHPECAEKLMEQYCESKGLEKDERVFTNINPFFGSYQYSADVCVDGKENVVTEIDIEEITTEKSLEECIGEDYINLNYVNLN